MTPAVAAPPKPVCPDCKVENDDLVEQVRLAVLFCNRCALTWYVDAQGNVVGKRHP